jgi:hypothetical protein
MASDMELFLSDDYETPLEEYPGYLGLTWDGEFNAADEALRPLGEFDLQRYSELVDEHGITRHLKIDLPSGSISVVFDAYNDFAHILDQLPTIKVYRDNGPPDAGPASGAGYLFFIADGVSYFDLKESIAVLVAALKSDLGALEANE